MTKYVHKVRDVSVVLGKNSSFWTAPLQKINGG